MPKREYTTEILNEDIGYMKRALELARLGVGWVNPNPLVGAVIVKDGHIIGEGYHRKYGELHAEREALRNCTENPEGSTLYVTLEPCCHHGKQPPCTDAIVESGIRRVVIGALDPNPLMSGKGIDNLRMHGVLVDKEMVCSRECIDMNEIFFYYIREKRPYVMMKYAQTLDGKIATHTGASRWITGDMARQKVHEDRHRYSAVMVGIGTVLSDNPSLTCRADKFNPVSNPVRIVCDSSLRTPFDCNLVRTAHEIPTWIATCSKDGALKRKYEEMGCRVLMTDDDHGRVHLTELMRILGKEGIDSLILEGGAVLNWQALKCGIVNRVQAYIAPKIFGGALSPTAVGGEGVRLPEEAYKLKNRRVELVGDDILVEGEL